MAKNSSLNFTEITGISSYAIVSAKHSLADHTHISFGDIEEEKLIIQNQKYVPYGSDNPLKDIIAVHQGHYHDLTIDDDQYILTLAKAGYGIAILPGYRIPEFYDALGLYRLSIDECVDMAYGLIYKQTVDREYKKYLSALIKEKIKKLFNY